MNEDAFRPLSSESIFVRVAPPHWTRRDFIRRARDGIFGATSCFFFSRSFANAVLLVKADDTASTDPLYERELALFEAILPTMGTEIALRWFAPPDSDSDSLPEKIARCVDDWVEVLSDYQQDSQAMEACRRADGGDWVEVSPELNRMLELCDQWNKRSLQTFDAALGALTSLRRRKRPATDKQWEQARQNIGWSHLEFDFPNRRFRSHQPGVRFDFGAIGKGFIADRVGELFAQHGIERFNVNASGNMRLGSSPPGSIPSEPLRSPSDPSNNASNMAVDSLGWPIVITTLSDPNLELLRLRIHNCGIATSGDQWQKFRDATPRPAETTITSVEDGNSKQVDNPARSSEPKVEHRAAESSTSSHIVDPNLARGLTQRQSASVIADDAANADAMATAACVHLQRKTLSSWLEQLAREPISFEMILQTMSENEQAVHVRRWKN